MRFGEVYYRSNSIDDQFNVGFGFPIESACPADFRPRGIERAVDDVLQAGVMTPDLGGSASTRDVTEAVLAAL